MNVASIVAIPLEARFADVFGGADKVPAHISSPASHFRRIPRTGQVTTLVIVTADDGSVGYGECFGLPHPQLASTLVSQVIADFLKGAVIDDPAEMTADLYRYFIALGGTHGAAIEALSGVDIALWDLKARAAGMPLATLLGGKPGPVDTYVSPVGLHATPAETVAAARAYGERGFHALKLKIGRGAKVDSEHLKAVRDAMGDDFPIYLDANCAYDEGSALAVAEALAPYAPGWLEEPIPPGDPLAYARLRERSAVPLGAGENEFTLDAFRRLVEAGAVDFLQPNISRAGGVSGLLAIGALCEKAGIVLAPHGVGGAIAVAAAVHTCRAAPAFGLYEANMLLNPLRDELSAKAPLIADGNLVAQDLPGHGAEPDPAMMDRFRWTARS